MQKSFDLTAAKKQAMDSAGDHYALIAEIGGTIWEYAELARREYRSAHYLTRKLEELGFSVERGTAGFPTGFVADFDNGPGPTIGLICEYDALPGLSSVTPGEPGQGCGHNLYAAGAVGSALLLKNVMLSLMIPGRVRVFGTPSEESLGAKQYYVRQGLLDGTDVVFSVHQYSGCGVFFRTHNAFRVVNYRFIGRASHAGSMPELGRSALDALELMNVGVQFLREHITPDVRIHYSIMSGKTSANVVPDFAAGEYIIRAQQSATVSDTARRVELIAQGAAMMTETQVERQLGFQYANTILNRTLCEIAEENVRLVGPPSFDEEDQRVAQALGFPNGIQAVLNPLPDTPTAYGASSDEGDVSWKVPLVRICMNTAPLETPNHSEIMTRMCNLPAAYKAMTQTTKAVVCTALDLLCDPEKVKAIHMDFERTLAGRSYVSDGLGEAPPETFPNAPGVWLTDAETLTVNPLQSVLLQDFSSLHLTVYREGELLGGAVSGIASEDCSIHLAAPVEKGERLKVFYSREPEGKPAFLGYFVAESVPKRASDAVSAKVGPV